MSSTPLLAAFFALALTAPAVPQTETGSTAPGPLPARAGEGSVDVAPQAATFRQEELDQLLAPIALYPDDLLGQVLMAATYPLEIVEADRWAKAHADLAADAAAEALEEEPWDPSVKSLVGSQPVLAMLSTNLEWTRKLGDAFLAQQEQVMDTVQALRKRAQQNGALPSTDERKVEVEKADSGVEVVRIESTSPTIVYVPVYDPVVVYGPWWYDAYPPWVVYPWGYHAGGPPFFYFTLGFTWGYAWSHCDWHHHHVVIDVHRNTHFNHQIDRRRFEGRGGVWRHDPVHRANVPYRDAATAQRFGGRAEADVERAREERRGRVAPPDGTRPAPGKRRATPDAPSNPPRDVRPSPGTRRAPPVSTPPPNRPAPTPRTGAPAPGANRPVAPPSPPPRTSPPSAPPRVAPSAPPRTAPIAPPRGNVPSTPPSRPAPRVRMEAFTPSRGVVFADADHVAGITRVWASRGHASRGVRAFPNR